MSVWGVVMRDTSKRRKPPNTRLTRRRALAYHQNRPEFGGRVERLVRPFLRLHGPIARAPRRVLGRNTRTTAHVRASKQRRGDLNRRAQASFDRRLRNANSWRILDIALPVCDRPRSRGFR